MSVHNGPSAADQIIWYEQYRERVAARLDELRRAAKFLELCEAAPEQAKATGAMRDAHEWVLEVARKIATDPSLL